MKIPDEVLRTTYSTILGRIIAHSRKRKGLTQVYMAHELGINQPAYSHMECGRTGVDTETLSLIAARLGSTPQSIIEQVETARRGLEKIGVIVLMYRPVPKNMLTLALLGGPALGFLIRKFV